MKKTLNFFIKFLFFTLDLSAQIGPNGAMPGLKKWLVSESTPIGQVVMTDRVSPEDASLILDKPEDAPLPLLNYNTALFFGVSQKGLSISLGNGDFSKQTIFMVSAPADLNDEKCLWAFEKNDQSQVLMTTDRVADLKTYRYMNFATKIASRANVVTYYSNSDNDQVKNIRQTLRIGGKPLKSELPVTAFKGHVAEIMLFDRVLSGLERKEIESYLALKYGAPLQGNYFNSRGEIVWDAQKNALYTQNVTGIGRDDVFQLNQKQSCGSDPKPLLKMGATEIAGTNTSNSAQLINQSFLIWGKNAGLPFFDAPLNDSIRMLATRWCMVAFGQIKDVATELQFAPGQLAERPLPGERYALIIDRSGSGKFAAENTQVLKAESVVGSDGAVVFQNIQWDTDCSGSDVFTLAALSPDSLTEEAKQASQSDLFESLELWPNPSADGFFQVAVKLKNSANLSCLITDEAGKILTSSTLSGSDRYFFSQNIPTRGAFLITFSDGNCARTLPLIIP